MALGRQFLLLLWKNWTLQKRKVCVTVFELLLPLFFGTFLVLIRSWEKPKDYQNNTIWSTHDFTRNLHIDNEKSDILYAPNETAIDNIMAVVLSSVKNQKVYENKALLGKCFKYMCT
jgi:ATP-binding cassette subfamily A (ABC1) protein 3